jgi:3-deoxy-manno-octulosonate cytidylyltransferase (CMP-KDO synthetase)
MTSKNKILFLIPARYQSTRFPGKSLALLDEIPVVGHVIQRVSACKTLFPNSIIESCVVTDDERIEKVVSDLGHTVKLVKDETVSGTDRIKLAFERFYSNEHWDLVINVQGDEPLIDPQDLTKLIQYHLSSSFDITTIFNKISYNEASSPNKVKIAMNPIDGRCLYFSRSIIPFDRNAHSDKESFFGHVGVYSFRPSSLIKMSELSETVLEKRECLEQLRALENGLTIGAIESKNKLIGVDTPEDLIKVQEVLNETN